MKSNLVLFGILLSSIVHAQTLQPATKRLTAVVDGYPSLSPDGRTILYESDRTGNSEIYTMNVDGSDVKQLTFNAYNDDSPTWSPDGRYIAFTSLRDGLTENDTEIYIMDHDGKNQTRLTRTPGDDSHPHFSFDGKRIVFNSARTTPDLTQPWSLQHHEIFSMMTNGSDVEQLTRNKTVSTYPSLSPDGKQIVFRKMIESPGFAWDLSTIGRNSEVFVMELSSGRQINISNNPAYDGWPAWTPDGHIVLASNRAGIPSRSSLYLVNADGTGLRQITDSKYSYNQHSISADGKYIVAERNAESFAGIDMIEFTQ